MKVQSSKKPKFLATILPVSDVDGTEVLQCYLPTHLNITGYTREEYARLSNIDQENLWKKCYFWCTNDKKMRDLLSFLSSEKKSAYSIFLLEDTQTDVFSIISHDQPGGLSKGILRCKYVTGVGFMNDLKRNQQEVKAESSETLNEHCMLRNILHSESKTHQSLDEIPQGSVQAAPKVTMTPTKRQSCEPMDWDTRVVVKEGWECDEDSNL
jgi:hypothetical protein